MNKIYSTVKNFGHFKAPGPDGFQAIFCQSQWQIIGSSFCNMIRSILSNPRRIEEINDTFITLIPKLDVVTSMKKNFRPIGLCNVSCKTITKIIASRIRGSLDKLIGPAQCVFVPERQGQDNIIVTHELFHSPRRKKGSKGWMAIKIDLEKAYDRLGWSFIKDTLMDIGISDADQPYMALHFLC